MESNGEAVKVWRGRARHGMARRGRVMRGGQVSAWSGLLWNGGNGVTWHGDEGCGEAV